ncbi:Hypothetical protein D9617_20g028650 [Elsinoe fawcettii]|nr:Hypothetical protein D9617_20g028650 [Elsinoe fawcettii]
MSGSSSVRPSMTNSNKQRCDMKHTQGHCCQKCLRFVVCNTRTFSTFTNSWLWTSCYKRDVDTAGPDIIDAILVKSLINNVKHECRLLKIDFDDPEFQAEIFQPALAHIKTKNTSTADSLSYTDEYAGGKAVMYGQGTSLKATPSTPSVDAELPKFRVKRGNKNVNHKHVEPNISIIKSAVNRFKWTSLPGFLAKASAYAQGAIPERKFLDFCNQMLKARLKSPMKTSELACLPEIDDKQWASDLAEKISCISGEDSSVRPSPSWMTSREYTNTWATEEKQILIRIYKAICKKFNTREQYSKVDQGRLKCPWVLGEGDEDELNNMLSESWAINSMKYNLNELYYPELKQIIKDLQIPKRTFDPDRASEIKSIRSRYPLDQSEAIDDEFDEFMGPGRDIEDFVEQELAAADKNRFILDGEVEI